MVDLKEIVSDFKRKAKFSIIVEIIGIVIGLLLYLFKMPYALFIFLVFSLFLMYSLGIRICSEKEKFDLLNWRKGIEGIVKGFLFILILMSIGRIGVVLIHQTLPESIPYDKEFIGTLDINPKDDKTIFLNKSLSEDFKTDTYNVTYKGINKNNLSFNLTIDEEAFAYIIKSAPIKEGQVYFSPSLTENMQLTATNQPINNPINISRKFKSEPNKNYLQNYFSYLSLDFIRSEIGRILFLIILINIFLLVPYLINGIKPEDTEKPEDTKKPKVKNLFCGLIITTLILALILTLTPQGDIGGTITFNISFGDAIAAFLIIISFILVYLFMNTEIDGIKDWLKKH